MPLTAKWLVSNKFRASTSASALLPAATKENSVVAEGKWIALQEWWLKIHSSFCLGFTVCEYGGMTWRTTHYRDCDPSGHSMRCDFYVKKSCPNVDQKEFLLKTTHKFRILRMIAHHDNYVVLGRK
jgi:hypothetical protein